MATLSDEVRLDKVLVKFGPNDDGAFAEVEFDQAGGGSTADCIPQACALVTKETALGGRKGRGRTFLPGIADTMMGVGGIIDSLVTGAIEAGLVDFREGIQTAGWNSVLLHNDSTAPTPLTGTRVSSLAATQRRRIRR